MSITVTEAASKKVQQLIDEEENQQLKLRVFVTGGGCSGFQYGFTFDENQKENDMTIEKDGVKILIDSLSFQYLMGSEVDYTEGLQGSRFIINNPQAKTTCGCGSSFSI
ncbi:iron-sulfur cluster insertion protein ErpA [Kangiella marina]|uniref:Iron-sulfur cluster insertion protein ErpA n=1 Tax=Kangiella marina TaxID=1079178 RepID=A0ABP8ILN1_9GAMM